MSEQIDSMIASLDDWRGPLVARLRAVIAQADPGLKEEWKWGTAVWTSDGNVCAAGAFKDHVKLNFFKGASLKDPAHLFNGGLEAKDSRSIDFQEGDVPDDAAVKDLVRAAVAFNREAKQKPKK